jgi:hypothetical protein
MLTDTDPQAELVLNRLLHEATASECVARACALTQWVRDLSRQGIEQAHQNKSPQERALLFAEVTYGREWAERLREHLQADTSC